MHDKSIFPKTSFSTLLAKLDFLFAQNKIAIIEKETEDTYEVYQYLIKDGWKLMISKNSNPSSSEPSWILKKIEESGKQIPLKGVKKTYLDKNSKHPKVYD